MQIIRIHIENFGKLHDFDMEFRKGLNRISAANGWGKSTLAAFLKAMFYGLEVTSRRSLRENERKKYLPWQGGTFGGSMEFAVGEKRYLVERFFGPKEREDTFCLYDLETGLPSSDYSRKLGEELFRLDRTAYERSSYFAQQDFSVSVNDSLNARLTRVEEDAGDMRNYEKAYASLETRSKYYRKTGNRGRIPELQENRRKVLDELEICRTKELALAEQKEKIAGKESEDQRLQKELRALEERARTERSREAFDARRERLEDLRREAQRREDELRETQEQLEMFGAPPPEEEELDQCQRKILRLQELGSKSAGEEARAEELSRQAEELRREGKNGGAGAALWLLAGGLFLAGAAAMISGLFFGGGLLLAGGLLLLMFMVQKERNEKIRKQETARELHKIGARSAAAVKNCRELREQESALRREIQEILMIDLPDGGNLEHALEEELQKERKKSRRYAELLRDYGIRKREAKNSRTAYEQFREGFSPEDLARMYQPFPPEQNGAELEQNLQMLREQREILQKEMGQLQSSVQSLAVDAERIPELEEEAERLSMELASAEREHRLLEAALQYLKEARERFSARYLEKLQRSFLHYQKCLDPENGWEPVLDVKLQVRIPGGGAVRELEYFSAGEQDLIRIAERFAIVDALYEEEQPVLILDDPFVNLDTGRYARAVKFLEEMSEKRQMIYFTCRE